MKYLHTCFVVFHFTMASNTKVSRLTVERLTQGIRRNRGPPNTWPMWPARHESGRGGGRPNGAKGKEKWLIIYFNKIYI